MLALSADAAAWATTQLADSAPVAAALAQRADAGAHGPTPTEAAAVVDRVERLLATGDRFSRPR